jgi:hypothetical protein
VDDILFFGTALQIPAFGQGFFSLNTAFSGIVLK